MTDPDHNAPIISTPRAHQLTVRRAGDQFVIVDGHGCFFARTYFEPDARRIATVFGMLAALKTALPYLKDHAGFSDNQEERAACEAVEQAVAEAEGRIP